MPREVPVLDGARRHTAPRARRPRVATVLAPDCPLTLRVAFKAVAFSPTRANAWWPRTLRVVADALGVDDSMSLGQRVSQMQNPMGTP